MTGMMVGATTGLMMSAMRTRNRTKHKDNKIIVSKTKKYEDKFIHTILVLGHSTIPRNTSS